MMISQPHLSLKLCAEHFQFYSSGLTDFADRVTPLLTADLSLVTARALYVCPLCTRQFLADTLDGVRGSAEFSADHLPPDSVGGRYKVLTCKKCNNDFGHVEAELLHTLNFGTIPDKRSGSLFREIRVIDEATRESYRVSARRTDNNLHLEFNAAAKLHNEKLKTFISKMHAGEYPKLTLQIAVPDQKKLGKAILKSSYLLGFVFWGYEFVYSKYGEWIREVLEDKRDYPARVPTRWVDALAEETRKGVSILRRNGEKICFLMTVEIFTAEEKVLASTIFPNPTANGWDQMVEFARLMKTSTFPVEATTIPRTPGRKGYFRGWTAI